MIDSTYNFPLGEKMRLPPHTHTNGDSYGNAGGCERSEVDLGGTKGRQYQTSH